MARFFETSYRAPSAPYKRVESIVDESMVSFGTAEVVISALANSSSASLGK